MDKSPDAFRTISEVADHLETPAHVLRFWESRFPQIRPVKRAGGRRYYRPSDVALLAGIKRLLHYEGLTIRGVQKILRDQGVRHVAGLADDSVPVANLVVLPQLNSMADSEDADPHGTESSAHVPEAGFIAVEDDDDHELDMDPDPAPVQVSPVQSVLPLFDNAPGPAHVSPRQPTLRDNINYASLVRALPPKSLVASAPQLAGLARRLAALRAQMAARAQGGQG